MINKIPKNYSNNDDRLLCLHTAEKGYAELFESDPHTEMCLKT